MLMFLLSQSDLPRYVAYSSKIIMIPFFLLLLMSSKEVFAFSDCVVSVIQKLLMYKSRHLKSKLGI